MKAWNDINNSNNNILENDKQSHIEFIKTKLASHESKALRENYQIAKRLSSGLKCLTDGKVGAVKG